MTNRSGIFIAGVMGFLGGTYLLFNFICLSAWLEPLATLRTPEAASLMQSNFGCVMSLCLVSGSLALLTLNGPEQGWRHALGVVGTIVTLLGAVSFLAGCVYVLVLLIEHYATALRYGIYHG